MSPEFYCLSQPYNPGLVALALTVCGAASLATFSLYPRAVAKASRAGAPAVWIVLTTITGGSAVWATHFTAMLAFDPGAATGYDAPLTLLSLIVAMAMTGAAFSAAVFARGLAARAGAGVMLGLATAAIHYIGVSGMRVAGLLLWSPAIIAISVVVAVLLSVAAITACGFGETVRCRGAGALLFALSIAALHFTGMAAITVAPDPAATLPGALLSGSLLAAAVGAVALLIIAAAITARLVDRQAGKAGDIQVRYMAQHDMLTHLPNRILFEQSTMRELTDATVPQRSAAIFCLDLDGFKEVNDIFGYAAGDALLIEVARRLKCQLGQRCVAARLGGDEFAILATGLNAIKTPTSAAQHILDALAAPYQVDGNLIDIGCSIGIALFPEDGLCYAHLLARADIALSKAKADGRGVFRYFEPAMDESLRERRRIAADLRNALHLKQFSLAYQPQYDLKTGRVSGFEALIRWDHSTQGRISPSTFIAIAEETGIILSLGEWVLREACREAASWGLPLSIAVNLSVAQFRQADLLQMITSILAETGLSSLRLEVEVTESLFFEGTAKALQTLEQMRNLGIRIAMDDFGTGFSSLSTLQSFPFDKIKIDQSFTNQIGFTSRGRAIVTAVASLGAALGITVIAEGVETAEQADFLRDLNCSEGQGYLFGRPLPITDYSALLRQPGGSESDLIEPLLFAAQRLAEVTKQACQGQPPRHPATMDRPNKPDTRKCPTGVSVCAITNLVTREI